MKSVHGTSSSDDAVLTIAEAAQWSGRSEAWVRMWRTSGPLEAVDIDGRQGVTLSSLRAFAAKRARPRRRPVLRLVINNDL
jgi:hypothetical protein